MNDAEHNDIEARLAKEHIAARLFGEARSLRIGKYLLLCKLGAGGMGVVFEAYDARLDRSVALKLLLPHRAADPRATARLMREAQAMARVCHPNVVQVFDVEDRDGSTFIAMELVRGPTLASWLRNRPWVDATLEVFIAIAHGLHAAHTQGVVHRDFKPENVLLTDTGVPKVADFGLASTHVAGSLTRTGETLGTLAYMAPEQVAGGTPSAASDQYAFCVTLFEALAGHHPRLGSWTPRSSQHKRTVAVLRRGMATEASKRYPTMQAVIEALERARKPPRWPAAAGVACAALTVAAGLWVIPRMLAPEGSVLNPGGLGGQRSLATLPHTPWALPSFAIATPQEGPAPAAIAAATPEKRPRSAPAPRTFASVERRIAQRCKPEASMVVSFVVLPEGGVTMPIVEGGTQASRSCATTILHATQFASSPQAREMTLQIAASTPSG